jgi:TetR/AcrR family transcriptional regulator, cholesterol catabolism regulator
MPNGRGSEVIRAAITVFSEKGYSGTSVQDVANALGMPKGTLYHYISSKEDMLEKIFALAGEDVDVLIAEIAKLDVVPLERLRLFVTGYAYLTTLELERTRIYNREWRYLSGKLRDAVIERRVMLDDYLVRLIDAAKESGDVAADLPSKRAAYFIWGALASLPDWYRRSGPEPAHRVAAGYTVFALKVVLREPAGSASPGSRDDDADLALLNSLIRR